jgi:DNA invertase Pin-like site-specific DNA recombinase
MRTTTGTAGRVRVAIYIRLSRETAESASIDTQRAAALTWLASNGFADAEVTEYVDAGVSGAKALEERKQMRELMRDKPDVIIAWKLDRYARSVSEFLRLVAWGEAHGARVATTDNTINTATPTGRMVATVLAALAEWERDLITGRILDGQATRRQQGRWVSGSAPYGYAIERREGNQVVEKGGAAYLVQHSPEIERVREAVDSLLVDGTVASTSRMLDIGEKQWRRMLTNGILRGHFSTKGKLILDADGIVPVQFVEPLITAAEAQRIRERLNALAVGEERAPRQATPMITNGMGTCYKCTNNLNGGKRRDGVLRYRCKIGCVVVTASHLDDRIEDEFLTRWGGVSEYTVRFEGGNDLSAEMIEAKEKAERLVSAMASAGPLMLAQLDKHAVELEAVYAALQAAHDPDVREVLVPTGRTLREAWEASDKQGRTKLLSDVGLHVVLHPKTRGDRLEISWAIGGDDHDLAEMLGDLEAERDSQ